MHVSQAGLNALDGVEKGIVANLPEDIRGSCCLDVSGCCHHNHSEHIDDDAKAETVRSSKNVDDLCNPETTCATIVMVGVREW